MRDEAEHLSWVSVKLDEYANSGHAAEVEELMDGLTKTDGGDGRLCQEPHFAHFFGSSDSRYQGEVIKILEETFLIKKETLKSDTMLEMVISDSMDFVELSLYLP